MRRRTILSALLLLAGFTLFTLLRLHTAPLVEGSGGGSLDKQRQDTDISPPAAGPKHDFGGLRLPLGTRAWFGYARQHPEVHHGLPNRTLFKEVILGASFPRTGSTWMYTLMEQVSGVEGCTLYDETRHPIFFGGRTLEDVYAVRRTRTEVRQLGPNDNCVAKTHFPYIVTPDDSNVRPSRLVQLVRNPIDAVLSLWDYERRSIIAKPASAQVGAQGKSLVECAKLYERWMMYWHQWTAELNARHAAHPDVYPYIPTLTVRYEDLCERPLETSIAVLDFAGIHSRVDPLPAFPSGCRAHFGKNLAFLSPLQLEEVVVLTRKSIEAYGYSKEVDQLREMRGKLSDTLALPWSPPDMKASRRMCSIPCSVVPYCPRGGEQATVLRKEEEVGAGSGEEEQAGEADDANALFALRHALSHDPLVQVGEGEAAPEGALPGQFRRPKKEPRKRWDP